MTVNWNEVRPAGAEDRWFDKALAWAKRRQEALAIAGIVVLLLAIGVPYYLRGQAQSEASATDALNLGQLYLRADVDPVRGPFKSYADKYQQCLQTFQHVGTNYPGTDSAKLSRYYLAQCQYYLQQYSQAYNTFEQASRDLKGTPLGSEAKLGMLLTLMAQGQWDQAAKEGEGLLAEEPNSFLAPELKLQLSDVYFHLKDPGKARAELKEAAAMSPDSSWGLEAQRRLAQKS